MLQTEFVKNLNSNYERILLEEKPEEKRYQYCILSRGGIKGLLPCSLRYLDGKAYLYYDITSKQNVAQLFQKRNITREWVKDFLWSFRQIQLELERFLLDERNVLWYPEQIFQDLEDNIFSFLYLPYYEGDSGFGHLIEFLVEHIDYGDETLVEYIYKVYEQFQQNGDIYLRQHIFTDAKVLECERQLTEGGSRRTEGSPQRTEGGSRRTEGGSRRMEGSPQREEQEEQRDSEYSEIRREEQGEPRTEISSQKKKGIFSFLEHKKRRNKEQKNPYQQALQISMEGMAVAEEMDYATEDYGRTIYIEEPKEAKEIIRRLYSPEGKILAQLGAEAFIIGKKKEEADLVLEDLSISRMHARITKEGDDYYLEDMNSTNGTFKNGLRLQPYEKRKLQEEDEIKLGKVEMIFR